MAVFSIIKKSELEGAQRIDAEYYQPSYLGLSKKVRENDYKTLKTIAFVTDGEHGSPDWDDNSNVKYIVAENIKENYISDGPFRTISESQNMRNQRASLEEGDVLVYSVGMNTGLVSVFEQHLIPASIPRSVALIRIQDEDFSPEFVAIFLNSKFGKFQTKRLSAGNAQPMLALENIMQLEIPTVSVKLQKQVVDLYGKAYLARQDSKNIYKQAEAQLLNELGVRESDFEDELSYVVDFSEATERADAEYFQPKYKKLVSKLESYGAKSLPDVLENVKSDFSPASSPDKEFKYVELSNIDSSIGVISGASGVLGSEAPSRAKRLLQTNDVLVSSVEGSLEKVALVDSAHEGSLASTGFFQFRSQKLTPEVLLVISKSLVLQLQLKRQCAGTILTAVPKDSLKNIVVPILPKPTQQKIGDLVRQSHLARQKSKQLLDQAKRQVEELIEKGRR